MACHVTAEAIANSLNESNSDMEIITGKNNNRELDSSSSEYDNYGGIEALSDVLRSEQLCFFNKLAVQFFK